MSLYKKISYGYNSSNPVVLDIGESYTKLGFASESSPRSVIPTTIQQVGGPVTYILKSDHNSIVKHHYDDSMKKSIIKFFEKIFYKELQVSPKNQKIIICESLLNPTKIRELIAKVLFQFFEVAALVFAPQHLLACFTIATGTALVIDCSYGETLVLPVIDGTPLLWAWESAPLGGAAIHDELQKRISSGGKLHVRNLPPQKISASLSENVLEDIKVKACFVAEYERAKKIQQGKLKELLKKSEGTADEKTELESRLPNMVYPLNGSTRLIIPGEVREEATEVLFEQDNDRTSVPTLVLDALCRCPLVSRKSLAASLLITGGTSLLPGFRHRLLFELKELVATEERYKKLSECDFRVHNPPVPANLVSWLGASIFASLDIFKRRLVTKEYFEQHNEKLPDWCNPPFPDKLPDPTPQPVKPYKAHLLSRPR